MQGEGGTVDRGAGDRGAAPRSGLEGRAVFATASGAGIGRAIVLRLLAGGARVMASDLDAAALGGLARDAAAAGHGERLLTREVDGTDEAAVARAVADLPGVNALYNGIGWVHQGSLMTTDRAAWDRSFLLNVTSMWATTRAVLPRMIENGGGPVLCMASVASSLKGLPNRCAYSTTKAAVLGFMKSLAADHIGDGVRANAICPGTIESPSLEDRIGSTPDPEATRATYVARQPIGRLGRAEEIAEIAAFLLSDHSAYVTGSAYVADGGITL